jgi:hypothetical protein
MKSLSLPAVWTEIVGDIVPSAETTVPSFSSESLKLLVKFGVAGHEESHPLFLWIYLHVQDAVAKAEEAATQNQIGGGGGNGGELP